MLGFTSSVESERRQRTHATMMTMFTRRSAAAPSVAATQDRFEALKPTEAKRMVKDPVRYKTVLCNKFETAGKCPYGPRCQFAHGVAELRARPALQAKPANQAEPSANGPDKYDEITPPTTPRKDDAPLASLPATRYKRRTTLEDMAGSACVMCDLDASVDNLGFLPPPPLRQQSSAGGLGMNELGRVVIRREASHHALTVRRMLSNVFADDGENDMPMAVNDVTSQLASGPFGCAWVQSGPIDVAPAA